MSIQGKKSTSADVARFWIYLTNSLEKFVRELNTTFNEDAITHIRYAFNKRIAQIPPAIAQLALFLDPKISRMLYS
jgi:DNA polymerase III delta subunit